MLLRAMVPVGVALCLVFGAGPVLGADDCGLLPDLTCDREAARFEGFPAPMSAPIYFEDPFITTSLSAWGIYHQFPDGSVFQGGDARAAALQVRVALTDRLALLATKDGYLDLRPDLNLLDSEQGFLGWGFGFKYALIQLDEPRLIVSPSIRYETTNGTRDVLQGNGEGAFVPAVSAALEAGPVNVTTSIGMRLPVDGDAESQVLFYHLLLAHPLNDWLIPFVQLGGMTYTDGGSGETLIKLGNGARLSVDTVQTALGLSSFEGYDVANLGSSTVEGDDVFSWTIGLRAQVTPNLNVGLAWERPLTKIRHVLKQRVLVNALFEF